MASIESVFTAAYNDLIQHILLWISHIALYLIGMLPI